MIPSETSNLDSNPLPKGGETCYRLFTSFTSAIATRPSSPANTRCDFNSYWGEAETRYHWLVLIVSRARQSTLAA